MVKLNLNALSSIEDINSSSNNNSETTVIETKVDEVKIEEQIQVPNKKKFSFKELNISGVKKENKIESTISEVTENIITDTVEVEEVNKKPKLGIKSLIKKVDTIEEIIETPILEEKNINAEIKIMNPEDILGESTQIIEEKSEETNDEVIKTEVNDEVKKVVSISDGDTSCEIIATEETEIFGSYKGSFSKNDEVKKEVVPILKKEITPIIKKEEEIKTNLQSYSENDIINKKNKSKKIIFTSIFTIISLSLSGFFVFQTGLIKSNIQETNNISENKQEETVIENTNNIDNNINKNEETEIIEENLEIPVDNNINENEEIEVVKENLEIPVDNNINSSRINKKVENFLLKKYKNK